MFRRKKKGPDFEEIAPESPFKVALNNPKVTWTGHLTFVTAALVIISRSTHCAILVYAYPWRWFQVEDEATLNTFFDDWTVTFAAMFAWYSVIVARRRWIVIGYFYGFFSLGYQVWCYLNLPPKYVFMWPPPKEILTYMKWCRVLLAGVMGLNQFIWTTFMLTFKTPF